MNLIQRLQDLFKRSPQKPMPTVKHKWQLVTKTFAPPAQMAGLSLSQIPTDTLEKMILGVTTYLWECLLTGEVKTEEVLGSDTPMLDELLVKAKQFGRQVVRDDNGATFIIEQYQEPVDASTLPMRKI